MANPDALGFTPLPLSGLTVTASTAYPGWPATNLVDGIIGGSSNSWSASAVAPAWVQAQLASAAVATAYTIIARLDAPDSAPSTWTFEGSNDGSSWTTLDTQSGQSWNAGQRRQYIFSNSTSYVYYRLNMSAAQGGAATWPSFTEWEVCSGSASSLLDWWKADAITSVSDGASLNAASIIDSSGHGHSFNTNIRAGVYRSSSGPNSKPFIDGSTTSGFVYSGSAQAAPTHDLTYFAVVKTSSSAAQSLIGSVNAGGAQLWLNNYKVQFDKDGITALASSSNSIVSGAWTIIILSYERDTGNCVINIHGLSETIGAPANQNFTSPGTTLSFGGYRGSTTNAWQGGVAEIGRYTTVLSPAEKNDLYAYLVAKYFPNAPLAQTESLYTEVIATGSLGAQTEAVYTESLTSGVMRAQTEAVYAEALATGVKGAQAESLYIEVLKQTEPAQVETVYAETLLTSTPNSQVETVYAESVLFTNPPSQVEAVYIESALTITPRAQIESNYLEVVLLPITVQRFVGWGMPI